MTLDSLIIPITLLCALGGGALVLLWSWSTGRTAGPRPARGSRAPVIEMDCTACHRQLMINPLQLQLLSGIEKGLAVRSRPKLVGRKLAEYVCPFCEAAHCFTLDGKGPEWAGTNLYQGQQKSANCFECRVPLRRPAWPRGTYDGRVTEAPGVRPDHGMRCSRCQAVCCHGCCAESARRRGEATELFCPRCMRKGITAFFHP